MNKAASTILLLLLWVFATGCGSQAAKARVRMRVFEMPTQALRLHLSDQNPRKLSDSAYSVSVVSRNELDAMLQSSGPRPWMLTDRTRVINDWPWTTDTWVYAPERAAVEAGALYAGGGVGSLGVRERGERLQVHFDYLVSHRSPQGKQIIDSKLFYEHAYSEGQVLLFHTPSSASDGSSRHHVIAFEISRENRTPDVLAYR
jgi:hypothetical protein